MCINVCYVVNKRIYKSCVQASKIVLKRLWTIRLGMKHYWLKSTKTIPFAKMTIFETWLAVKSVYNANFCVYLWWIDSSNVVPEPKLVYIKKDHPLTDPLIPKKGKMLHLWFPANQKTLMGQHLDTFICVYHMKTCSEKCL